MLQEQFKAELANWQGFDAMYDARLKAFSLYNVMPQEVEKNVAQTMSFYVSAIVTGKQIGRASCRERVSSPV